MDKIIFVYKITYHVNQYSIEWIAMLYPVQYNWNVSFIHHNKFFVNAFILIVIVVVIHERLHTFPLTAFIE